MQRMSASSWNLARQSGPRVHSRVPARPPNTCAEEDGTLAGALVAARSLQAWIPITRVLPATIRVGGESRTGASVHQLHVSGLMSAGRTTLLQRGTHFVAAGRGAAFARGLPIRFPRHFFFLMFPFLLAPRNYLTTFPCLHFTFSLLP